MTLIQLRYFLAICENDMSMSKAAKISFVSQSTVSLAIKDLEKEFNITLFFRTTKHMELTEEGHRFFTYAKAVVDAADMLEKEFTMIRPEQKISVGFSEKFQGTITRYLNTEQGKKIFKTTNIFFLSSSELIDFVNNDTLDCAVISTSHLDSFPDFNVSVLGQSIPVIYTSRQSYLAELEKITPNDLTFAPMVVFMEYAADAESATDEYNYFIRNLRLKNIVGYTTSIQAAASLVKHNSASVIIGDNSIEEDEDIVKKYFQEANPFEVSAIWKKSTSLPQTAISLLDAVSRLY